LVTFKDDDEGSKWNMYFQSRREKWELKVEVSQIITQVKRNSNIIIYNI
jgi:hypothetical protein